MKNVKCPKCGFKVRKVIGVKRIADPLYYIDRERFGWAGSWYTLLKERRRKTFISFYCRNCSYDYPKEMEKQIWKHLRLRKILRKLEG